MPPTPRLVPLAVALALAAAGCFTASSHLHHTRLAACESTLESGSTLRVASYNIKAGVDSSLDEIAEVLREIDADVVALQEVDLGVPRSEGLDQTEVLAQALGYPHFAYASARKRRGGDFGVAVLSRLPLAGAERIDLHGGLRAQPRAALDATVCVGGAPLRVVSVHADFVSSAARRDIRTLRDRVLEDVGLGVIIAGDLNVKPHARGPDELRALGLVDLLAGIDDAPTFPGFPGPKRIDYFFADAPLAAENGHHGGGVIETRASDHFPIWVDVPIRPLLAVHGLVDEEDAYAVYDGEDDATAEVPY